jgi:hypothetical protein
MREGKMDRALEYVYLENINQYQPERRKTYDSSLPTDRRIKNSKRFTSDQYDYLVGCLNRREQTRETVARKARRARHLLVAASTIFLTLLFSSPGMTVHLPWVGLSEKLTILQFSAAAPLLIAYLVSYASHQSMQHIRILHECKIIDSELQKFGCPTSHALVKNYNEHCEQDENYRTRDARRAYHAVSWAHGIMLLVLVCLSFIGSTIIAIQAYKDNAIIGPHAAFGLFLALFIAIAVAIISVLGYHLAKRMKEKHLHRYFSGIPCDIEAEAVQGNKNMPS